MLTSAYSNLSLSCLSLIFGPGLLETQWFVEMPPGRTKDILQYDNAITPASENLSYKLYINSAYMHYVLMWQFSVWRKNT